MNARRRFPLLTEQCDQADVAHAPFPHLVIPNALPQSIYDQLSEEFPNTPERLLPNERLNLPGNSHRVLNEALSPLWREFVLSHSSTHFLVSVQKLFAATKAAPWLSRIGRLILPRERRWGFNPDDLADSQRSLEMDGFWGFQIAVHAGSHESVVPIGPHFDSRDKLFSCLFYLRSAEDSSKGGELELHQRLRITSDKRLGQGDSRIHTRIPYSANTAVLFPDSPAAIHAVGERPPTTEARRFCFISAHIPRYDHGSTLVENLARVHSDRIKRRLRTRLPV